MSTRERCRRCGGNLFSGEDVYSRYLACLQCGTTRELTELGSLDELLAATLGPQRARLGLAADRPTVR
jgi:hypothetical protein